VGSCRREILDHVIVLNEQHLLRLMRDYVNYHHEDAFTTRSKRILQIGGQSSLSAPVQKSS
jgi:hypothetical protein